MTDYEMLMIHDGVKFAVLVACLSFGLLCVSITILDVYSLIASRIRKWWNSR
jgi:hypothetical protein